LKLLGAYFATFCLGTLEFLTYGLHMRGFSH